MVYGMNKSNLVPQLNKIYTVHSFHLNRTGDMTSTVRKANFYLEKLDEADGVIVLSPQQCQDIVSRFGYASKVHFIPHTIDHFPKVVPFSARKPYKVVAAGRLASEKQHDLMIQAFAKVVEKIPEATLEIFGRGGLKVKLTDLISQLGLTNNVFLRDFTDDIYSEFSTAQCSLLTSSFEGQPLVVLESLASGCPVIAWNFRYGPAMMIQDGENGFIAENYNIQAFADKILAVLSDSALAEKLSTKAYESAKNFSEEKVAPRWRNFIEQYS